MNLRKTNTLKINYQKVRKSINNFLIMKPCVNIIINMLSNTIMFSYKTVDKLPSIFHKTSVNKRK